MAINQENGEEVGFSVEDQFSIIDTYCPTWMFPHPFTIANLAMAMEWVEDWRFLWDFRKSGDIYNDVIDAYEEASISASSHIKTLLVPPGNHACIEELADRTKSHIIPIRNKNLPIHNLNLDSFNDDIEYFIRHSEFSEFFEKYYPPSNPEVYREFGLINNENEYSSYIDAITSDLEEHYNLFIESELLAQERAQLLDSFLKTIGTNSLLSEIALVSNGGSISIVPYHSYSTHNVITPSTSEAVLIQPGRASEQYWRYFKNDIYKLERAINQSRIKESEIEKILRDNPLFLRGLNYGEVFHQVILPRQGASDLCPDIIARPINSKWYDIIELKLPSSKILVGRDNRRSLSASIVEAASQLREYSAYFDDRKIARVVEEKYGIKCYKPKLVVIIGKDHNNMTQEQSRRTLTAYPDLEIITYDNLLMAARKLLLL